MTFEATVVPLSVGQYGPFKDDEGTERQGRTIPYLTFAPTEGGESERATAAEGVALSGLSLMQPVRLTFELYRGDGKLKLRCHGAASTPDSPAAA